MSIVEIRCPQCGSSSSLKDEERHVYRCDHCGTEFVFVDPTKQEVIYDTRPHNCPICGRPVRSNEGYSCTRCGKQYLCSNCIKETVTDGVGKIICIECDRALLKEAKTDCLTCGAYAPYRCPLCGSRSCEKDSLNFEIREKDGSQFSLYCPNCKNYICNKCYTTKLSHLGGKAYYCGKCGGKLQAHISRFELYMENGRHPETH